MRIKHDKVVYISLHDLAFETMKILEGYLEDHRYIHFSEKDGRACFLLQEMSKEKYDEIFDDMVDNVEFILRTNSNHTQALLNEPDKTELKVLDDGTFSGYGTVYTLNKTRVKKERKKK